MSTDPELERLLHARNEAYLAVAHIIEGLETYGKAQNAVRSHEMAVFGNLKKVNPKKGGWWAPWSE
jgi:hypothetical protein